MNNGVERAFTAKKYEYSTMLITGLTMAIGILTSIFVFKMYAFDTIIDFSQIQKELYTTQSRPICFMPQLYTNTNADEILQCATCVRDTIITQNSIQNQLPSLDSGIHAKGDVIIRNFASVNTQIHTAKNVIFQGYVRNKLINHIPFAENRILPTVDFNRYQAEAKKGGIYRDTVVCKRTQRLLGPLYIKGDLFISTFSTIKLMGTIFVEGSVVIRNFSVLTGQFTLCSKGTIYISNGACILGEYPAMLIATQDTSINAITVTNGASVRSCVLAAPEGTVHIKNGAVILGTIITRDVCIENFSRIKAD